MRLGKKLMFSSIGLLALPWLGIQYLEALRAFLLDGQERAQLLAAQAVAVSMQNRDELFDSQTPTASIDENALYVYPLDYYIQVDGYKGDWEEMAAYARHFAESNLIKSIGIYKPSRFSYDLVLGQREQHLYALLQVTDASIVYRHPRYNRIDKSDHLRLSILDSTGLIRRYIIASEGIGAVNAFEVDKKWKLPVTGKRLPGIRAYWQETARGYNVELSMPLSLFNYQQRLDIAVVDVEDPEQRTIKTIIGTMSTRWSEELNRILFRSPELERIIEGLKRPGSRVWLVDRLSRVRAYAGDQAVIAEDTKTRGGVAVQQALQGDPASHRYYSGGENVEIIQAAYPILSGQKVLGAVIVELGSQEILAMQRKTLEDSASKTAIVLLIIVAGLLLFSFRLTWRIHRLRRAISRSIDDEGRVQPDKPSIDILATDEIGDLSRGISSMLARINRYTQFLENMPRTLRHEINNPLNTISTSLQTLADDTLAENQRKNIESAERGVKKISHIVQDLSEAASLEEALKSEKLERLDLSSLVKTYVDSCRLSIPNRRFEYLCQQDRILIDGNDIRIEQLLDKLIDNAVEFSSENSEIRIQLKVNIDGVKLSLANEGPSLPEELDNKLFESMTSYRSSDQGGQSAHLGIGLFVVRLIAEYHGGQAITENLADKNGVVVTITFPLSS